jgi:replicative DNA helicase
MSPDLHQAEMNLIKALHDNPEEFISIPQSPDEILGWFDDLMNRQIASEYFKAIQEHGEMATYYAEKAVRSLQDAVQGIGRRLDECILPEVTILPSEAISTLSSRSAFHGLETMLRHWKANPADGLDYAGKLHKATGEILKHYTPQKLEYVTAADACHAALDAIEAGFDGTEDGRLDGLGTGVFSLDEKLGPIRPGMLIIVAGRPGAGKSALISQMFHQATYERNEPACAVNMELPIEEQAARIISVEHMTGQSIENVVFNLKHGRVSMPQLSRAVESFKKIPGYFITNTSMTIDNVEAMARMMAREKGAKYLFVDYLTLIAGQNSRGRDHSFFSEVAQRLKALAIREKIAVVAAAQFNRESSKAQRPPALHDLRESGGIEQAADKAIGLWLREPEKKDEGERIEISPGVYHARAIIMKNRQGPQGSIIDLAFNGITGRFNQFEN